MGFNKDKNIWRFPVSEIFNINKLIHTDGNVHTKLLVSDHETGINTSIVCCISFTSRKQLWLSIAGKTQSSADAICYNQKKLN